MSTIRRSALVVTLKISALLRYFNERLVNTAKKLQSNHAVNNLTVQALENLGNDAKTFKRIALETASLVSEQDQELKDAVYLYFLTKQLPFMKLRSSIYLSKSIMKCETH